MYTCTDTRPTKKITKIGNITNYTVLFGVVKKIYSLRIWWIRFLVLFGAVKKIHLFHAVNIMYCNVCFYLLYNIFPKHKVAYLSKHMLCRNVK